MTSRLFVKMKSRSGGMPLKERYRQGIEWGKKVQERTFLSLPVSCRKRELIRNFRYTVLCESHAALQRI